jgi:hypothetical protein
MLGDRGSEHIRQRIGESDSDLFSGKGSVVAAAPADDGGPQSGRRRSLRTTAQSASARTRSAPRKTAPNAPELVALCRTCHRSGRDAPQERLET